MRATPAHIINLMYHIPFSGKLGPEDAEAYVFANELRKAAMLGKLKAVFTHPANELAYAPSPALRVQAGKARALGLITGTPDYLFCWSKGCLGMEFKSKTGTLTEGQKDFMRWCADAGVPYVVVRSSDAALAILVEYGVLVR
jgi:hypothetical protein